MHPFRHHLIQNALDEIKALGLDQAGYDAEQRRRRIFLQAQHFLQAGFVLGLALETPERIVGEQSRIRQRVVNIRVNAVDDPDQPFAAPVENAVEFFAPVAGLDFLRVGRTDGRDVIGELEAALEKIDHPVKFQRRGRRLVVLQVEHIAQYRRRKHALILQVVNRANRFHGGAPRRPAIMRPQQDGDHPDMPVVAVDDIRRPVQAGNDVQHGLAEESEPLRFVVEIVQAFAAEVVFVVDKIESNSFVLQLK